MIVNVNCTINLDMPESIPTFNRVGIPLVVLEAVAVEALVFKMGVIILVVEVVAMKLIQRNCLMPFLVVAVDDLVGLVGGPIYKCTFD
jgi:hypothetical protein